MNKKRFIFLLCTLCALLCITAFAKTHKTDIVATDTIEYTLEEEDKLSAELFIEEDGLYDVKLISLSTSGNFAPKISIKVFEGNKEIYSFVTDKKRDLEGTEPESYGFLLGLSEGEYRIEIENLTKFSDVTFKIETVFAEEENIESYGNKDFENATVLALNEKYFGSAVMSDEVDYFSFEMPYDGVAYIQMYSSEAKFFTLYDEDKNEIGSIGIKIDEADKIYELRSGLAKGTYYISVQPDEDYSNPLYTLKIETTKGDLFEKEYNNAKVYAMPIESGKEYQGNLFGIHDIDIYIFTLSEKANVTIDFTDTIASKDNHYEMTLSGKDGVLYEYEGGRVSKELSLDEGTYYFTVKNFDKDSFTSMIYKLEISSDKGFAKAETEEKPEDNQEEKVEQFADVNEDKWYYDEILEAKKLGLINGVGDNLFKPEENVSVAEVLVMALNTYGKIIDYDFDLEPLEGEKWYDPYVLYTRNLWYNMGDFDSFERPATRAELAYIFGNNRLIYLKETKKVNIPDVDENTKYYKNIQKLYNVGILNGDDENGTFYPDRNITRAEAAAIILRIMKARPKNLIIA